MACPLQLFRKAGVAQTVPGIVDEAGFGRCPLWMLHLANCEQPPDHSMNFPNAAVVIAAQQGRLEQDTLLSKTAKGQLRLALAGQPISVTQFQTIFALPLKVAPERPIEEFVLALEDLLREGAFDSYRLVTETDRHRCPDGPNQIAHPLATPVVLAVRARSAGSTAIGPAAQ